MLHCGQFGDCKYSTVCCISVYSNEVPNVKNVLPLLSAGITLQWVGHRISMELETGYFGLLITGVCSSPHSHPLNQKIDRCGG